MFQNSDYSSWNIIIQFSIICVMLIIGNVLRRKIPFLKKLLFPTAIIAGMIGLGFKYLISFLNITVQGQLILTNGFLEAVTYHTIALGFIAMGLKSVKKEGTEVLNGKPFKTGLLIVSTYLLQGVVGILITVGLSYLFKSIAPFSGLLLPMGFGQGPGQANNIGMLFEQNGFIGGKSFGLGVATFGILWACVAGIIYINKRAKSGELIRNSEEEVNQLTSEVIEEKGEIPLSEAIDKFSIQVMFVLVIYGFTYLIMNFITSLVGPGSISSLIWGFNFIFAMLFAMLFKAILNGLRKSKLMKRKYTNEYMLDRITGLVFDFMIVASIMSINLEALSEPGLWTGLLILTTVGGFLTYFYLRFAIKRIYPDYEHEAFASLFGNLAGTASNGIALLREIDPQFKTPAADDLVTGSSTAVLFGAPLLLITGVIYYPEWYWLWGSVLFMAICFGVFNYFLFKGTKK